MDDNCVFCGAVPGSEHADNCLKRLALEVNCCAEHGVDVSISASRAIDGIVGYLEGRPALTPDPAPDAGREALAEVVRRVTMVRDWLVDETGEVPCPVPNDAGPVSRRNWDWLLDPLSGAPLPRCYSQEELDAAVTGAVQSASEHWAQDIQQAAAQAREEERVSVWQAAIVGLHSILEAEGAPQGKHEAIEVALIRQSELTWEQQPEAVYTLEQMNAVRAELAALRAQPVVAAQALAQSVIGWHGSSQAVQSKDDPHPVEVALVEQAEEVLQRWPVDTILAASSPSPAPVPEVVAGERKQRIEVQYDVLLSCDGLPRPPRHRRGRERAAAGGAGPLV